MALFTIRLELHNATAADYEQLHLAMSQFGFLRTIVATSDGIRYVLPMAEYNFEGEMTIQQVLGNAQAALSRTTKTGSVLVTEAVQRTWTGLPVASPLFY
jgi:hypothetical protein